MSQSSTAARRSPGLFPFVFLAMAIGGLAYAALGFIGLQEAQIPSSWSQVKGHIMSHDIVVTDHKGPDGKVTQTFKPSVSYRYEVNGEFLIGTRLSRFEQERTIRGVAEEEIKDLSMGSPVSVYYDPADPKNTVLRKSDTLGPFQAISAGLCIGLGSLAIFIISWRRNRKPVAARQQDKNGESKA